jgi:predicted transcriptional regulator
LEAFSLCLSAEDIAYTENIYEINIKSSLLNAIEIMAKLPGIYRLNVIDGEGHPKGIISNLRVLDFMVGRRGAILRRKIGGLDNLLNEPVLLFMKDYVHKLFYDLPCKNTLSYMMENDIGHLVLVGHGDIFKGIITERSLIKKMPNQLYRLKVSDIMTPQPYTVKLSQTVIDALNLMEAHQVRRIPILDGCRVTGLVTTSNIFRYIVDANYHIKAERHKKDVSFYLTKSVTALELKKPPIVKSDMDVGEVIKKFKKLRIGGFPVLDKHHRLVGIITERDIFKILNWTTKKLKTKALLRIVEKICT